MAEARKPMMGSGLCMALLVVPLLAAQVARAEVDLVVQQQAKVLVRALAYDRGFKERAASSVDIGIVYNPALPGADRAAEKVLAAFRELEKVTVQGLPVRASLVRYGPDLSARLVAGEIDAVYLLPGLDAELASVLVTSRERRVITMGGKREYVEQGAALGVFVINGRPTILLNLAAAKAEGAVFGSDLLKIARVIN